MNITISSALQVAVISFAWLGLIVTALLVLAGTYWALRSFTQWIVLAGLFPTALAPALLIAARVRVTKADKLSASAAMIVLRELSLAEKRSPEFKKEIERLFPDRESLRNF